MVPLDKYLQDEMTKCETFFYFFNNRTNIKLDNPLFKDMENVTKVFNIS